jgi:hypothetical protein
MSSTPELPGSFGASPRGSFGTSSSSLSVFARFTLGDATSASSPAFTFLLACIHEIDSKNYDIFQNHP